MSVEGLVGDIYDSMLGDQSGIEALLCRMAETCGGMTASLAVDSPVSDLRKAVTPRVDPHVMNSYLQHWAASDPVFARAATMPAGHIGGLGLGEKEDFVKSPLYHESWKQGGLGVQRRFANLATGNSHLVNFAVFSDPRNETLATDVDRHLSILLPHLARATSLLVKTRQLEVERMFLAAGESRAGTVLFVLDRDGKIVFLDDDAIELTCREAEIQITAGRFGLQTSSNDMLLRRRLDALTCCNFELLNDIPIRWQSATDGRWLELEVLPCTNEIAPTIIDPACAAKSAVVVLLKDIQAKRDHLSGFLQEEYTLTHSEALLTVEMLDGSGREIAAQRRGISINTARAHLRSVFSKMSITREAELIATVRDAYRMYCVRKPN